jgi:ABC-type sugar transport system permease subunit
MRKLTLENKKSLTGVFFVSPLLIGLLLFFLQPLIKTIEYSFSHVVFSSEGLSVEPMKVLFGNFSDAFVNDPDFLRYFTASIQKMVLIAPSIVFFSLFIAIILNQRFIGRSFMRAMFFLPFILATGIVTSIIKQNLAQVARGGDASSNLFNPALLVSLLIASDVPVFIVNFLASLISNIMDLVWQSGLQVLIFIVGLLSIPEVYYEVAAVEGSTSWESFWKITFPLISPFILVSLVYTVIDSFTAYDNTAMKYIVDMGYKNFRFSYMSALFWIYFVIVIVFIGLVFLLFGRNIHYDK